MVSIAQMKDGIVLYYVAITGVYQLKNDNDMSKHFFVLFIACLALETIQQIEW